MDLRNSGQVAAKASQIGIDNVGHADTLAL